MKPTLLLTGATGFLGSHLLRAIHLKYHCIVLKRTASSLERIQDLLPAMMAYDIDHIALDSIFKQHAIHAIIHCATHYGRKQTDRIQILKSNLLFPLELLELAERYHVKFFLNTDTILDKRISDYTLSKRQFHEWLQVLSKKMVCVNVALEHFYGPFDDATKFVSHIILALLKKETRLELTQGEQKRDFIFIADVISAFEKIIAASLLKEPGLFHYELGSGKTVRIRDLVEKVQMLIGNKVTELAFGKIPYRAEEVMESTVNLTAIQTLNWTAETSLEQGLKTTIAYEKRRMGQ
ncbi:MAG: CDP-abequose synthase [uncultured bacterium]|nr:MAG: CDP-abequose synthase [uncultured bacterium]